ncbi:MAG: nickel pincer cofactor biosynthesis protein LarB [Polyangiaceae bacterium]|nr:nickel pincer cofactor biosynthesis protein LarB [Polyangiaceae bacterium]
MKEATLRQLLASVRDGQVDVSAAVLQLKSLPFEDVGYATVDHNRALRSGVPEVIFAQGKTPEQIVGIARRLIASDQVVLITRLDAESASFAIQELPGLRYAEAARVATFGHEMIVPLEIRPVAVVTAGTSDIPVAEEAIETLSMIGIPFERVYDVGVAGLHRLLARVERLREASALICVAGMEGALPSVVGGLVAVPVVAVPTSTGYGAALGGLAALMGMLTSCASGVTVVNIDNGFGAAMAVARMVMSQAKAV